MTQARIAHYLDWSTEGRSAIWRYLLVLVLTLGTMVLCGRLLAPLVKPLINDDMTRALIGTYAFLPGLVVAPLLVKWLLARPGFSLALPAWPGRWREYLLGVLAGWTVLAATLFLSMPYTEFHFHGFGWMDARYLLLALPIAVGFVFQTGFEELVFRGLFMQGTRALTRSLPVILLVQALVFGAMHIPNLKAYGGNPLVMTPYLLSALVLGWAAWRSGSLLLPMGLHVANNTFLTFFITMEGDIAGNTAPMSIAQHSLAGLALFGITQSALLLVAIEFLARRRIVGNRSPANQSVTGQAGTRR